MQEWSLKKAVEPGLVAVRQHWKPLLAIQIAAILVVATYYASSAVREASASISALKLSGGYPFSFLAGFVAGGLLPEVAKVATGRIAADRAKWLRDTAFNGLAYGLLAIAVDLLYQLQTRAFGGGNDIATIAIKTVVDQAIFSTIVAMPAMIFLFDFRAGGWRKAAGVLTPRGYRDRVLPALLPNWAFWIPVLVCVYAMPFELQFVFAMLMEAAWSIVFVFIATRDAST